MSRFVTLSVKSTFPPFSISSFLTSGSYLSASFCAGATVTFATTLSVESSGYVTTTGISTSFPASSFVGVYLISPVSGLIVAPSGAPLPRANFVPSGFAASLPSLSVKFGDVIVVWVPTFPSASVYAGVRLSVISVFFHTAYTVKEFSIGVSFVKSAFVASGVFAQPTNV